MCKWRREEDSALPTTVPKLPCTLLCFLISSALRPSATSFNSLWSSHILLWAKEKNGLEFPRLRRVTGISAAKDSTASGQGDIISTSLVRALHLPSKHLTMSVRILSSTLAPTPACSPPSARILAQGAPTCLFLKASPTNTARGAQLVRGALF